MNKNVMIVLAGGFVVAILVAVLVQASLGGKKTDDGGPRTEVLVAAKDLAIGTELSPGDLKWQSWPGSAFGGAIVREKEQTPEDALTGKTIAQVSSGQPVLASYIFKEGKGNIVAASLGKGMRAVAIPVKADTMAGGFVTPGDYVDVILSYEVETDSRDNPSVSSLVSKNASETILRNIKVIAVDQESVREDEEAKIARTVTLEVSSPDAEKLSLGMNMGDLTLALRGIGDIDPPGQVGATTDVQVGKVLRDVAVLNGGGEGASGTVRIYNGAVMQEVRTRSSGGTQLMSGQQAGSPANATEQSHGTIEGGE